MAVSTQPKSFTDVTVVLKDGGTPTTLTLFGDMDNFQVSGFRQKLNAVTPHQSRGVHLGTTHGQRVYLSGSFSFICTELSDAAVGAIPDFILKNNAYSGNVSTQGSGGVNHPYLIDIEVTIDGTEYDETDDHDFTLHDVEITSLDYADGDPIVFSVSFTSYGVPTGDLACTALT